MFVESFDNVKQWSYKLAKQWVANKLVPQGINSYRKFESYKRQGNYLPKHFPRKPDEFFKKKGVWQGWTDFFGKASRVLEKEYMSYTEASVYCQRHGIKNSINYRTWKNRPVNLPARPDQYYKEQWVNWQGFLDNAYEVPPKRIASKLTSADVRIIRHQLGLGVSGAVLAKTFGVSEMQISRIRKGENWVSVV